MQKRRLGLSALEVAPLAFGGNVFGWSADATRSFELLDAFVDAGFNLIDTADVYSAWVPGNRGGESETIIGQWLKRSGKVQKVLVRDWQKHPYKQQMLHMDFLRIDENAAIRVNVPIHFLNQEKSPAGKTSGVVISHNLTEVEVSCLPKDLPEFIELDLASLKPGGIVHLSQLKLPKGVEIVALHLGADHDTAVVTANTVKEEVEEAPAAEGGEGAAPAAEAPKK